MGAQGPKGPLSHCQTMIFMIFVQLFACAERKVLPQAQSSRLSKKKKKQLNPSPANEKKREETLSTHKPLILHTHKSLKKKTVLRKPGGTHTQAIFGTALFISRLHNTHVGLHYLLDWSAFFHYFPCLTGEQTLLMPLLTISKNEKSISIMQARYSARAGTKSSWVR